MNDIAIAVNSLSAGYAGHDVLFDVNLDVRFGEVLCILGHNGAGKSTLLKSLIGLHSQYQGEITINGVTGKPNPYKMARNGVAYLPEGRGVFPELSVRETFELAGWGNGLARHELAERIDEVVGLLPRLKEFWSRPAGSLSGGQQQMVSIGRTLLGRPSILLLDEPSIGLAPKLFQDLIAPIRMLQKERNMAIILVEQNVDDAFSISDRLVILKSGKVVFTGDPAEFDDRATLIKYF
jgi:ABC-type branched-subunit amino acid transport system ATPase component